MFRGPTIPTLSITEHRFAPDFTVLSTSPQTIIFPFSNTSLEEVSPGGLAQFAQLEVAAFGAFIHLKATFFEGDDFIIQPPTSTPVANATVYQSVLDAEASLLPTRTSFAALPEDRKGPVLIDATARIELEVVKLCQPKGSSLVEPDTQSLLWPRINAFSARGPIIDTILPSWPEAIAIYADILASFEIDMKQPPEPSESEGLVRFRIEAKDTEAEQVWTSDGSPGDFFMQPGGGKILSLLQESLPFGGAS